MVTIFILAYLGVGIIAGVSFYRGQFKKLDNLSEYALHNLKNEAAMAAVIWPFWWAYLGYIRLGNLIESIARPTVIPPHLEQPMPPVQPPKRSRRVR